MNVEGQLKYFAEDWTGGNIYLAAGQVKKWGWNVSDKDIETAIKNVYGEKALLKYLSDVERYRERTKAG